MHDPETSVHPELGANRDCLSQRWERSGPTRIAS